MDFVHTATGKPVNSPFKYELRSASSMTSAQPSIRILSLERLWGHAERDIRPGEEKFVLKEGLTCMLARPGKRGLQFTVPVRRREPPSAQGDAFDTLDLPRIVD